MRAPDGFHIEWVDDEAVVLDPETGTLHYLNAQAAFVYALILDLGVDRAVAQVAATHGEEAAAQDVPKLLEDMCERGLLQDD